jgi:hypothetical protein
LFFIFFKEKLKNSTVSKDLKKNEEIKQGTRSPTESHLEEKKEDNILRRNELLEVTEKMVNFAIILQ